MQNQTQASSYRSRAIAPIEGNATVNYVLPPLPYGFAALLPVISENALRIHYGRHNKAYVDELNKLVAGSQFAGMSLDQIMLATAGKIEHEKIFNNAAQAWNDAFYWRSLKSHGGGNVTRAMQPLVNSSFGDTAALKHELATAAATQFGSGWAWLMLDGDRLKVVWEFAAENLQRA